MKRLVFVLLIVLIPNFVYSTEKEGTFIFPFLKIGVSAKSAGMGNACVATLKGVDGLYSNPASLANFDSTEFLLMHHRWLEEVNFNYLAFVLPSGFGAGINFIDTGELKRTTYSNPAGVGKFKTSAIVITAGYGRKITDKLQIGGSFKYINQKIDKKNAMARGIDIGSLYQISNFLYQQDNLTIGAVIQNLSISKAKFIAKEEKIPLILKGGLAYNLKNLLLALDIAKPEDSSIKTNIGAQYQLFRILYLRGGWSFPADIGSGLTAGIGLFFKNLNFDAAYAPTNEFSPTFMFSLSSKF